MAMQLLACESYNVDVKRCNKICEFIKIPRTLTTQTINKMCKKTAPFVELIGLCYANFDLISLQQTANPVRALFSRCLQSCKIKFNMSVPGSFRTCVKPQNDTSELDSEESYDDSCFF